MLRTSVLNKAAGLHTRVYPKVSGLAA